MKESIFKSTPRDPERIPNILEKVQEFWSKFPDLRLGQLLVNCSNTELKLFYMEDDDLLKKMEEMYQDTP